MARLLTFPSLHHFSARDAEGQPASRVRQSRGGRLAGSASFFLRAGPEPDLTADAPRIDADPAGSEAGPAAPNEGRRDPVQAPHLPAVEGVGGDRPSAWPRRVVVGILGSLAAGGAALAPWRADHERLDVAAFVLLATSAAFLAGCTLRFAGFGAASGLSPTRKGTAPHASHGEDRRSRRGAPARVAQPSPGPTVGDVLRLRTPDQGSERLRRHERIRPRSRAVVITTDAGDRFSAEILDLSQSGVAIEGTLPGVWVGSMVTVGSRRAKTVRTIPNGMALEFSVPIPASALHARIIL